MTRDDLLTRLSQLLQAQFDEVVFRAGVPMEHVAGASAPQATRAIDVIRYLEQQGRLEDLSQILEVVAAGAALGDFENHLPEPLAGIGRPISSRIRDLMRDYLAAPFAGRDREVAALHTWLRLPDTPLGLLAAEAGRGKSALLVRWSEEVVVAGVAGLVYIPISIRFGTAHAAPVAKAIAGRLRHLAPGKQPIPVNDPLAALDECKDILGTGWSGSRPLLVILDGIDEAIGWKASDLIPNSAGKGIKLLVAARGVAAHWIEQLSWTRPRSFQLDVLDRPAIQDLVASVSELQAVAGDDEAIERFHTLTAGDPLVVQLHLRLVTQENDGSAVQLFNSLLQGDLSGGDPLQRFFDRWWDDQRDQWKHQRVEITSTIEYVLVLLSCAKGPLRLADLCALADRGPEALREALSQLSRLVIVDPAADRYVFSHSRLQDYFVERYRKASSLDTWKRRYLDYAAERFEELSAELPAEAEDFSRRFGYVLHYYALHLQEDAPGRLSELMCRRWLEGWRRLEADDGVYGGFYEDVSRAERHAKACRKLGEQMRALLIKSSVTSLSSDVPPLLMRRLVETRLWPLSRALRVIDRLVDDNGRAVALDILVSGVPAAEQRKVLDRAIKLSEGYRTRALAWMMPDLAEIHREMAFGAILTDGTLFGWRSMVNLDRFVECLSNPFAQLLLAAARSVIDPELRLRALSAIAGSAGSVPGEVRKAVLEECEHLVAEIKNAEHRAHYRVSIALTAITIAPEIHRSRLRAALDEIQALGSGNLSAITALQRLAGGTDGMDQAAQAEVIAALWSAVDTSDVPWLALSSLGPQLGRLGFVSQVLERSGFIRFNAHSQSTFLASLLPHAGNHFNRVWQCLWQLKHRYWMFHAVAPHTQLLSNERRTMYLDAALELVSQNSARSDLLGIIARSMIASDRDAPRLVAAARALPRSTSRARQLAACAHLAPDQERDGLVSEILKDARDIASRLGKRQLLIQVAGIVQTDQVLLSSTLEVSRQINDAEYLIDALEGIAVTLVKSGDSHAAVALAERAARTFAHRPGWVLGAHLRIITALSEGHDRTVLWNAAVAIANRLDAASGRAYFLAALAPVAPAPVKTEHALAAWSAIESLELPFQKAYTAVPLLPALDSDSRSSKLTWLIAQLSQDMSRFERYRLIHELMSRLDEVEIAVHRSVVEDSIDQVLRRSQGKVDPPGGEGELEPSDDDAYDDAYLDQLAEFLDLRRAREFIAQIPPEAVSTVELLATRLAELRQLDVALDAIRRLQSPDSRARALARLLPFLPIIDRAAVLAEVNDNLEKSTDPREKAEAEAFLIEHLVGAEREQRIVAALQRAPLISHGESRCNTLHSLAASAAMHLSLDQLDATWTELLRRIAVQRREEFLADIVAFLPIVSRLAGNGALRTLGETLLDVAEWFP